MIKKENEKNKKRKREDKARRKEQRKTESPGGSDMIAYVDEFGNLSSTPPDPASKVKVKAEDIVLGVPKRESLPVVDLERIGVVTMFNQSNGYGFIKDAATQESIFTHVNEHLEEIRENDRVTFRITRTHKGQNAVEVKLAPK